MADGFVVRTETQVSAPAATVFAFLIDPDKLLRWMGNGATMEAHPGGLYLLEKVAGRNTARGTFKEVVPVHRL
ncbi:MAG: SRPBCC domain-containing protein, partial [Bradyrhizobium sp.]|nr:SRPBCC domain-containing protein [Bradyrhizobium sp.]